MTQPLTCEIRTGEGQSIGVLVRNEKTFRSAKQGFHGQGKLKMDGQRYQYQCQAVEIGYRTA